VFLLPSDEGRAGWGVDYYIQHLPFIPSSSEEGRQTEAICNSR